MQHRVGKVKNIRVLKALRGEELLIDLGKSFTGGTMEAWMKKDPNSTTYRTFEIVDNRYLKLSADKTSDFINGTTGEVVEEIKGRWYFDVEFTLNPIVPIPTGLEASDYETKTIYTGTIVFINDITNSGGVEIIPISEASGYEPITEIINTPLGTGVEFLNPLTAVGGTEIEILSVGGNKIVTINRTTVPRTFDITGAGPDQGDGETIPPVATEFYVTYAVAKNNKVYTYTVYIIVSEE